MLARITRLQRLSDQLPPQWYGQDDQGNPIYIILHKGFLSIRRGGYGGGLESAQVGDEIYGRQVDVSWDPGYGEIKRLCEDEVGLPEQDYGDTETGESLEDTVQEEHSGRAPFKPESETVGTGPESVARADMADSASGETREGTRSSGKAGNGGTGSQGRRGPGGPDIEGLIRQWTSSVSAAQERQSFNDRSSLNRIRFEKLQKVKEQDINRRLREVLGSLFTNGVFEVVLWADNSYAVPDSEKLKLVVLRKDDPALIGSIMRSRGVSARVCRNTLLFLLPSEQDRRWCVNIIKYLLACEALLSDKSLALPNEQRTTIHQEIQRLETASGESVRRLYRFIRIPTHEGYRTSDLGASGPQAPGIGHQVYERLLRDGDIVERLDPLEIRSRYLRGRAYLSTADLYRSILTTPGEPRLARRAALAESIQMGVEAGIFGIGRLEGGTPRCRQFLERAPVTLEGDEVIVREGLSIADERVLS